MSLNVELLEHLEFITVNVLNGNELAKQHLLFYKKKIEEKI